MEGVVKVGETLIAKVTPDKATVDYKWLRADAEGGDYVAIDGATNKTYELVEADEGKWIKVEVKGTGNYTGTKTKVVGPVADEAPVVEDGELVAATDYTSYENWKDAITDDGIDFSKITQTDAIKMGIATDPDFYGVAMYLEVDGVQVDLSADNVKSVVRTDPDGDTTEPLISGENKYQFVHNGWGKAGEYTMVYTLQDDTVIEAKITIVSFEFKDEAPVVEDGELVAATDYTSYENWKDAITDDGIDFSKITQTDAIKMGIATDPDFYGVAMYLEVDGVQVDLSADNVKSVVRTDPDGDTTEPLISGENKYQFVHNGWGKAGEYTMVYTLQDDTVIEAKITIVSFEFKDEAPVVEDGELVAATDYTSYENWKDAITDDGIDFSKITQTDAIKMGIATDPDFYGVAMYLEVDGVQVDLSADNVKSVVRTDPDGDTTEPLISGENKYQFVHNGWGKAGEYTMVYTLQDDTVIEAKITIVSFEFKDEAPVVEDGELVAATDYTSYENWKDAITDDGIDFSKITQTDAIKMGLPGVDYYGIALDLKVDGAVVELNTDNLTKVERVKPSGEVEEPLITADGTVQFVHDGWGEQGEYTMYYYLKDGRVVKATIKVVSFEFKEEPVVVKGTWNATGRTGYNTVEGTAYVFQEFELLVDDERVSLHVDNVKSITVDGKALTPNTDETLWFNVQKETGDYQFVVLDNNDVTYEATLSWTAPSVVTATAEGEPIYNEALKATYQKYNVGVSLLGFDVMYQIKPVSGSISELTESGDDCLWFKVGADEGDWTQEEGDHIFLVKHDKTWSKFVVNYEAEEEPEVISGLGVAARDTDSISVGNVEGADGVYTVTATALVDLPLVASATGVEGKWFGLQLSPEGVTDITKLQYKTATSVDFADLTEADVTEAGAAGQIVWWLNGSTDFPQEIELKYKGEADATAIKLSVNFVPYEAPQLAASFESTGSYGINNNKVYAGYELQNGDSAQIPLTESNIESITVLEPNATEPKTLTVVGNEDPLLWFNIAKEAGTYTYTVVTKGEDSKTYEATLTWTAPAEPTVSFQAPESAEAVFTEASDDAPAQVDFSKVTADKLLDWTSVKDGYYAIELKIESVDLREENVKKAFRVYEGGTAIEPEIKGDLDTQYVTTDWELGTATMYYVLADNSLHKAVINFVNKTPKTALSEQSTYKLTHTGLAESYTAGDLVTGDTQEDINTAVEETIVGLEPVKVTLVNDVLGETGYDVVRIQPVNAGENIQLWAKDTSHNWYDINVAGWGPDEGFALPATYDVTTDIYILSDKAGDYELAIKLVDLSNDGVIVEVSGTVKVVAAQERAMTVNPATGATIEESGAITVTAPGADDLRIMLWAKELSSIQAAKDAYYDNERVFSARLSTIAQATEGKGIVTMVNGNFVITINQAFIDILEAGTRYSEGETTQGKYTWSAGDATTWLITPETEGVLWKEYATWDGEKVDNTLFVYNLGSAEPVKPGVIADPGVSPSTEEPISGEVAFTFGFKSATGNVQELELDIYLGENAGENRNYTNHLGINLPAGSDAVATWVDEVVTGYNQLDSKFHVLLAAAGYDTSAGTANKDTLKSNIFYTAGDNRAGTWTITLDTAVLGEEAIEFLVAVRDDAGAQWGNNNYVAYPDDVQAFLYNVTLDYFEFNEETKTIIGYHGSGEVVVIPSKINGVDVETIGDYAFGECVSLTSITIPNSVTTIGDEAFSGCTNLTSITIPNSVTSIGEEAFEDCTGLTSVTFQETSKVTSIGDYAFYGCTGLTSITIPNSVTSIGEDVFWVCTGLHSINVDPSNTAYSSDDGVLYNNDKTTLVTYPAGKTGNSFTIPNSVSNIGYAAFEECINLTSVTFQETSIVESIGDYAFYGCTGLTSITIPNSVTSIGEGAFAGCTGLTSITIPNSVTSIGEGAFEDCIGLTSITIPNSVTSIGEGAFYYCENLTSVTFQETSIVESIGDSAFSCCTGLASITIPNSVTSIGEGAFEDCTVLTIITFQETSKVTSIGDKAFSGCTNLTSITIPNSVTTIGNNAFYYCENLTSVTFQETSKVTSIGDKAFSGCTNLWSITIPNSVTSIGEGAFSRCTVLTSITIPNSVTTIGNNAFYYCENLTSITMERAGVTIGDYLLGHGNNNFRTAYAAGGAGTYTGIYYGDWTKVVDPVPVTGASITGTAKVGETLTAVVVPEGATATYQWTICNTADGEYADIAGATASTYTPVAGDAGKYIKVVATGTGEYSGSVTSDAVGPVETEDKVFNITQSKGYDTIKAAIDEAAENDIIEVGAGTYGEALSIGKSLTILGVNADNDARTSAFLDEGSIVRMSMNI